MNLSGASEEYNKLQPIHADQISYIIIDTLPDVQRIPFLEWLYGQTIIAVDGRPAAFYYDYEKWHDYWVEGQEAPIYD
jgi:hypothetical protein